MKQLLLIAVLLLTSLATSASELPGFSNTGTRPIDVSVYPNPSQGEFHISVYGIEEETSMVISNLIGQPVAEYRANSDFQTTFDLSHLPRGIYFLSINSGDKHMTKRLVLQ